MARPLNRRGGDALYTQFCIGVELGDDSLVRELIQHGANTMVSYGVDGVITTPMHSALSKGDVPMALALLTSKSTKVKLADLDAAPKIKRELATPILIQRLSMALEDGGREMLLQRPGLESSTRRPAKVALSDCLIEHFRATPPTDSDESPESPREASLVRASSTDRPHCPPDDPALSQPEESEEDESEEEDEVSVASSASSSAHSSIESER